MAKTIFSIHVRKNDGALLCDTLNSMNVIKSPGQSVFMDNFFTHVIDDHKAKKWHGDYRVVNLRNSYSINEWLKVKKRMIDSLIAFAKLDKTFYGFWGEFNSGICYNQFMCTGFGSRFEVVPARLNLPIARIRPDGAPDRDDLKMTARYFTRLRHIERFLYDRVLTEFSANGSEEKKESNNIRMVRFR